MFVITAIYFEEIPKEHRVGRHVEEEDDLISPGRKDNQDGYVINGPASPTDEVDISDELAKGPRNVNFDFLPDEKKARLKKQEPNFTGVVVSLFIFMIHFNGFAVQETITTPLVTDVDHKYTETLDHSEDFAYILFSFSGILSMIGF